MTALSPRSAANPPAGRVESSTAEMFAFLGPGLVHSLSNQVFKISRTGEIFADSDPTHLREVLQSSCGEAQQQIDLMRILCGETDAPMASGTLLDGVVRAARVTLRDRGVGVDCTAEREAPLVRPSEFLRTITGALRRLADELESRRPVRIQAHVATGCDGRAHVTLRLAFGPGELPFPFDWQCLRRIEDPSITEMDLSCGDSAMIRFRH